MDFQRFLLVMLVVNMIAKFQALPINVADRLLNKRRMADITAPRFYDWQVAYYLNGFAELDQDRDGLVTPEEVRAHLRPNNLPDLEARVQGWMTVFDARKDGSFDQGEWMNEWLVQALRARKKPSSVFLIADRSGDDFIDAEEFQNYKYFDKYYYGTSESELQSEFQKIDVDGNDKIDLDELEHYMHGEPKTRPTESTTLDRAATASLGASTTIQAR